jgi:hypothetical protein
MKGLKYMRDCIPRGDQALEFHPVQYASCIGCISTCVMRTRLNFCYALLHSSKTMDEIRQ